MKTRERLGRLARGARRAGLVAASLVCSLLLTEVVFRLLHVDDKLVKDGFMLVKADAPVLRVAPDHFLRFDLKPGGTYSGQHPAVPDGNEPTHNWPPYHVHIDQFGAREPTHPAQKPPGTFRILFVGASTLYGAFVNDNETIPAQLESQLNAEPASSHDGPAHFEAWNFGVHGYVLSQEAHRARTEMRLRDPDLILVQLHNRGPRNFWGSTEFDAPSPLETFSDDPDLIPESFPAPCNSCNRLHVVAWRWSAVYRALIALRSSQLVRQWAPGFLLQYPYAENLGRREARLLLDEASSRHIPVVFVGLPIPPWTPGTSLPGELPAGNDLQFVSLYEPGQDPAFYELHPPAQYLSQYAGILIRRLRALHVLPDKGGG